MAQPHLIIYIDANFGGLHTHIFDDTPDFTQLALAGVGFAGNWNDRVSSVVIVSGVWQFFSDINFAPDPIPVGGLGPGLYSVVADFGLQDDSLSSVRVIGTTD